jgi:Bestrophin, RFP-TM, chloride channel
MSAEKRAHPHPYNLSTPTGNMSFGCIGPQIGENAVDSWAQLKEVEDRRRDILRRVELPFWRILLFLDGTCLRALAMEWMIWVPILIFAAIRCQARLVEKEPGLVQMLGSTDIDVLGGFLSFLLVLFVNQTNTRFFDMYALAKRVSGQIQDVAGLASTQLPPQDAHRIVRYMNAAHIVGYVGLGGPYSRKHFFEPFNQQYNLLTPPELRRVYDLDMDAGSAAFKELVTWTQREVGRARKAGHIDSIEAAKLHDHILNVRASMDGIYDYTDQPTHFFYIHFLCLLSALYLPLFAIENAYSAGWGDDSDISIELLNGTIVLCQAIFVVGLRLLGQIMIDPFGLDLEDLSVITYVSTTITNTKIILDTTTTQLHTEAQCKMEELLINEKIERMHK